MNKWVRFGFASAAVMTAVACGSPSEVSEEEDVGSLESGVDIGTVVMDGKTIVVQVVQLATDNWVARYLVDGRVIQETRVASHAMVFERGAWNVSRTAYLQIMASMPRGQSLLRLLGTVGRTGIRVVAGIATIALFSADVIGAEGVPLLIPGTCERLRNLDDETQTDIRLEGRLREFMRARRLPGYCTECFDYVDTYIAGANLGWQRLDQWCQYTSQNRATCTAFYASMSNAYLSCSQRSGGVNTNRGNATYSVSASRYPLLADVCVTSASKGSEKTAAPKAN